MQFISVQSVTKHFGPEPVLSGVDFDLRKGDRMGLVGPNGSGKTTLLRILAGLELPDDGVISISGQLQVGYLNQQPEFSGERTLWQEAMDSLARLRSMTREAERLADEIAQVRDPSRRQRLGERFDRLQHEIGRHDAYHLDHRVEKVLDGLGFETTAYGQPVGQLSGGQQNRLLLAKLLLEEPDILLLDEPSNHLDTAATQWLETYLVTAAATLIVVSHDRYLLDKVTNRTLELFRGTVEAYRGNFTAYRRQKRERLAVQQRTFRSQQDEVAKLEDFIRRHHHGQKHAQAEDRRKKLERMERVDPPREINAPALAFPRAPHSGQLVLRAEGLGKSFERPLFRDLSFEILRGQRWGIFGANGTGKTTLLRCLLGEQALDEGRLQWGTGVQLGYFDQRLESVDPDQPVVDAIRPARGDLTEPRRRDLLARFGVTGEMAFQPVAQLSGGERNRVALARLAALHANCLLLDEPTNHLDLWAREALERALLDFDGTVLLVSHDRYFLNRVANFLLVAEPEGFRVVQGNYDFYQHLVRTGLAGPESRRTDPATSPSGRPSATADTGNSQEPRGPRRKRRFPYRKVADLEAEIMQREQELEQLQLSLSAPDVLRDAARIRQIRQQCADHEERLTRLYLHWEEAVELQQ
jgi:ATP-binding cassette subfamily F protein 3